MHDDAVGMGYEPRRNFGCIIAAIVIAPFAWFWLIGNSLGGFGCEGHLEPCRPQYGTFWLGVLVLGCATLALAWLFNAVRQWFSSRRD